MKYSVFTVMTPEYTPKQIIAKCAKLGYDGIEFRFRDDDDHKCSVPIRGVKDIASDLCDAVEKHGLAIPIVSSYLSVMNDRRDLTAAIEGAAALGAPAIRIGTPRYLGHQNGSDYHTLLERSRRVFKDLIPVAKLNGVRIMPEIHVGTIIPSCSSARLLADGLNPDQFGIIHDAGNMVFEGFENYMLGLQILGEYLGHVHVKNGIWGTDKPGRVEKATKTKVFSAHAAPMNAGMVNWVELIRALKKSGYEGWLSFEDFNPNKPTDVKLKEDIQYLKLIESELVTTPATKKWRAKKVKPVKLGLIGCGGMGRSHLAGAKKSLGEYVDIAAVCDVAKKSAQEVGKEYGAAVYTDHIAMLESGDVEAVLIATPHFFHPDVTIDALERNIHVLCEKPVAVRASDAARMNAAARKSKALYSAMFMMRTHPMHIKLKELLSSGEMGEIRRIHYIINEWYRSQAYYDSGSWRGTWKGEGGGILMNQCPHNLDLFYWWFGLPKRVNASVLLGAHHNVEIEDEVTAQMEMPNGAQVLFFTTTSDLQGINRLDIYCEKGKITLDDKGLSVQKINAKSVTDYTMNTGPMWGTPTVTDVDVTLPEVEESIGSHARILKNFCMAIRGVEKLYVKGSEGVKSLELANAMLMSGLRKEPVDFPLNHAAFDDLLEQLQAGEFNS